MQGAEEIPTSLDKKRVSAILEPVDEGEDEMPDLPVYKLTKGKRMIAAQALVFNCKNLEELDTRIRELKEAGFNTLIVRVFQNKGDRHYAFSEADSETGVYFKTTHAPVVDDILADVAVITRRHGMDIFAWMTTRYADYGVEERPGWHAVGYDLKNKSYIRAKGLNLFNRNVKNHLLNLYRDLAAYDIDGILFQDDLVLRHTEGFSEEARKGFARFFGKIPDPDKFYHGVYEGEDGKYRASSYGDEFWQWCSWKNENLLSVAREIMDEMKGVNPDLKFAINFMYEAALSPKNALAWLSQDLEKAVKEDFDYYAVMAYHRQIAKELKMDDEKLAATIGLLVENTLKKVGDPEKALIKLQIADWKSGETIPVDEISGMLEVIREQGGKSIALVPYRTDFDFNEISGFWADGGKKHVKSKPSTELN